MRFPITEKAIEFLKLLVAAFGLLLAPKNALAFKQKEHALAYARCRPVRRRR